MMEWEGTKTLWGDPDEKVLAGINEAFPVAVGSRCPFKTPSNGRASHRCTWNVTMKTLP